MTFKAARCPSCNGELQLPDNLDVAKCMYCGSSVIVRVAIQNAAKGNIGTWIMLAAAAADANNHQEAYDYYTRVLEIDPTISQAWAGKASAAGWMSTLASFRLPEMLSGFQKAIECAAPELQTDVKHTAALQIHQIIDAYYRIARQHLNESYRSITFGTIICFNVTS